MEISASLTRVGASAVVGLLVAYGVYIIIRHRDTAIGSRPAISRYTADPSKRLPKGPKGTFLLGNQPVLNANAHRYLDQFYEWRKEYGLGYELTIPGHRIIEVNHPAWLEHFQKTAFPLYGKQHLVATNGELQRTGIFTSDGQRWAVQRKSATHAFSRNMLKGPVSAKLAHHVGLVEGLFDNLAITGEVFDFQDVMARFTMLFSMSIAFSTHSTLADGLTKEPACLQRRYEFVDGFDRASPLIDLRTRNALWKIYELFDKSTKKDIDSTIQSIYGFIEPLVAERIALEEKEKKEGSGEEKSKDLLSMFMEKERDPWVLSGWMLNVLFAGRDTTAFTLAWQLYELLQPGNRSKNLIDLARKEIEDRGLSHLEDDDHGDTPYLDYDDMSKMVHLTAFWNETTRLHPASARGMSICYQDDILPEISELGQPAVQIKKGDYVMWQDWVMNRLPSVWGDDCLEFKPDRFLDVPAPSSTGAGEPKLKTFSPWKYHSFNGGPRTCLGMNLARFEGLTMFSALLSRFDFELVEPDLKPKYTTGMNMGIEQGLHVRVKRRSAAAS